MRIWIAAAMAACVLGGCDGQADTSPQAPAAYSAAKYGASINDIARPQADRDSDAARKPGELLAFAQIDRGEAVGDYIMGGGYMTRLLAMAVGSEGKVYAFQPTEFIAMRPEYAAEQDAAVEPYPQQAVALRGPLAEPGFPEPLDTIVTVMNLHDLFMDAWPEGTAQKAIAALYDALKPGGTLVVVDHRAAAGAGAQAASEVHRMDEQLAMDALTAAGFVLEEQSDIYARPDDPRTAGVFDEGIRGRTDQFAWRFRKPG